MVQYNTVKELLKRITMANFIQKFKIGARKVIRQLDTPQIFDVDPSKYPALWALFRMAETLETIEKYETEQADELKTNKAVESLYKDFKKDLERYKKRFIDAVPKTNWEETKKLFKQKQRDARKAHVYDEKFFKFIGDRITEYSENMTIVRSDMFDKHLKNPFSR